MSVYYRYQCSRCGKEETWDMVPSKAGCLSGGYHIWVRIGGPYV